MSKTLTNPRVQQTTDRLVAVQEATWDAIQQVLQLTSTFGIVTSNDQDIDDNDAPCALQASTTETDAFNVLPGVIVFKNGAVASIAGSDIQNYKLNPASFDVYIVRFMFEMVDSGDITVNPFYSYPAYPLTTMATPLAMLHLTTLAEYTALSQDEKDLSVVIGTVQYNGATTTVDNTRDTIAFARPWFSPVDVTHRSYVGSGVVNDKNPHGTSPSDLTDGNYTIVSAMGMTPGVLAKPQSFGRVAGSMCSETIPSGSFVLDVSGGITGKAGAYYAPLGSWPQTILNVVNAAGTQVAAWAPRGRNVLAVWDPFLFSSAVDLGVLYTAVTAGSLPASMGSQNTIEIGDASADELIIAGGALLSSLSERTVTFTDVGAIPMAFDIQVGSDGKVYKRPAVIYCNSKLEVISTTSAPSILQPKQPTRLRVSIANFNPSFTEIQIQVTGTDENGATLTEIVTFTGPLTPFDYAVPSYVEQRSVVVFTDGIFASVTQYQAILRDGDGPNTTFTVFAEYSPERPLLAEDALLATVQWTGTEVTSAYSFNANLALDRRAISRGGGDRGLTPVEAYGYTTMAKEASTSGNPTSVTSWFTVAEDFSDPQFILYPEPLTGRPGELPSNSIGARWGYTSRKIPFTQTMAWNGSTRVFQMRLVPRGSRWFPNSLGDMRISVTLFNTAGSTVTIDGTVSGAYPPFNVVTTTDTAGSYYAATVQIILNPDPSNTTILNEVIQGYMLHMHV
jgi:hypothetical protein